MPIPPRSIKQILSAHDCHFTPSPTIIYHPPPSSTFLHHPPPSSTILHHLPTPQPKQSLSRVLYIPRIQGLYNKVGWNCCFTSKDLVEEKKKRKKQGSKEARKQVRKEGRKEGKGRKKKEGAKERKNEEGTTINEKGAPRAKRLNKPKKRGSRREKGVFPSLVLLSASLSKMKVFESSCTFDYPWANVSVANWRKYCAWNTQSTHVVAVDTLSRSVDPSTGVVSFHYPKALIQLLTGNLQIAPDRASDHMQTKRTAMVDEVRWWNRGVICS